MAAIEKEEVFTRSPLEEIAFLGPMILDRYFSKKEFTMLSGRFPDLQMERKKNGKIVIMSPVKAGSGHRESMVIFFLTLWWYQTRLGKTYSSSTGIELPDGAIKSPDCAWVSPERLAQTTPEEEEEAFLLVVPDFIVEVRSQSDRLAALKRKMTNTWMKNGVRLAWLIDPYSEKVYIYRQDGGSEIVKGFSGKKISGENILPGMELPLDELKLKGN